MLILSRSNAKRYPQTNMSLCIFQQMKTWIPWICEQAKKGSSIMLDISIYLEGIHDMLLIQGSIFFEYNLFKNESDEVNINVVLKLPWTHTLVVPKPCLPLKAKLISVQVVSKLGPRFITGSGFEVLDLALHDEVEEVRKEALVSMPLIVIWSGLDTQANIFRK